LLRKQRKTLGGYFILPHLAISIGSACTACVRRYVFTSMYDKIVYVKIGSLRIVQQKGYVWYCHSVVSKTFSVRKD